MSRLTSAIKHLIITLLAIATCGHAFASEGGSSGGGNAAVCQSPLINGGHPILLDLALGNRPIINDRPSPSHDQLTSSDLSNAIGMDHQDLSNTYAYKMAMADIAKWEAATLPLEKRELLAAAELRAALTSIVFTKTPYRYTKTSRDYIASESPCKGHTWPVIYYVNQAAAISIPVWNALGDKSREGILIHVSLRQIQLYYGMNGSDEDLQLLTKQIVVGRSRSNGLSLDRFFAIHDLSNLTNGAADQVCSSLLGIQTRFPDLSGRDLDFEIQAICHRGKSYEYSTIQGIKDWLRSKIETLGPGPERSYLYEVFQSTDLLFTSTEMIKAELGAGSLFIGSVSPSILFRASREFRAVRKKFAGKPLDVNEVAEFQAFGSEWLPRINEVFNSTSPIIDYHRVQFNEVQNQMLNEPVRR